MLGVYLLNIQKSRVSVWAPLRELFIDRGLRYTLVAAVFYAPSVVIVKQLIVYSDPYFANLMAYLAASREASGNSLCAGHWLCGVPGAGTRPRCSARQSHYHVWYCPLKAGRIISPRLACLHKRPSLKFLVRASDKKNHQQRGGHRDV
jgi:hypothetical protein